MDAAPSPVAEYLRNMRELLRADRAKFGMMVERQVQARLLPSLKGVRKNLEPDVWALLVFCLDGHEAVPPAIDDGSVDRAKTAAANGTTLSGSAAASFPRAALAVWQALDVLRSVGVYPPPVGR